MEGNTVTTKWRILFASCVACWIANGSTALAIDLTGSWVTDASVCSKVFVKKGNEISFARDSDQYGGGFIVEGNKIRGQMQTCLIKARKEDGNVIHFVANCADDIMASNVQFSVKVLDGNTIVRVFPGMGDDLDLKYSRCPN
jgi:hypothetical protein